MGGGWAWGYGQNKCTCPLRVGFGRALQSLQKSLNIIFVDLFGMQGRVQSNILCQNKKRKQSWVEDFKGGGVKLHNDLFFTYFDVSNTT